MSAAYASNHGGKLPASWPGPHPEQSASAGQELTISIVVPVYNEVAILASALRRLRQIAPGIPVVVVDGGSNDASREIARRFYPTLQCTPANRGVQMNHGAARLASDVLLFLHSDSELPPGFAGQILRALGDARVVGGCFRLEFDAPRAMLRFYSWWTRFRGRFLHFGDQAFFVRREVFERMGGFRALPFLEDVEFLRRLRGFGRFEVLPTAVQTSARRFLRHGALRQQLRNIFLVSLFELGVSAKWLARFYPPVR